MCECVCVEEGVCKERSQSRSTGLGMGQVSPTSSCLVTVEREARIGLL